MSYHPFKTSPNPRLADSCERCGRLRSAPCHVSLLDCVEGLREAYLGGRLSVEDLALRLPDGWEADRDDDPGKEGRHLALLIIGHLAEFQIGDRSEAELRERVAATR